MATTTYNTTNAGNFAACAATYNSIQAGASQNPESVTFIADNGDQAILQFTPTIQPPDPNVGVLVPE